MLNTKVRDSPIIIGVLGIVLKSFEKIKELDKIRNL